MYVRPQRHNMRNCRTFRPLEHDTPLSYRRTNSLNCRHCAYYGAQQCSMEIADTIEPVIKLFYI